MLKLGVIGAGNMATAIVNGITDKKVIDASQIMIYDIDKEKLRSFSDNGVKIACSEAEIIENCSYVLLAVKPQIYSAVLETIKPACKGNNIFISIAAGISGGFIKNALGYDAKVVLVMPNTPILVGHGSSALASVEPTPRNEFEDVLKIFSSCGEAVEVLPSLMKEVIALNGSSPAFIYKFAQIFTDRGVELGFEKEVANKLFANALIGSALMMLNTGKTHQELIDAVSSKGGTTVAGLQAMEEHKLKEALLAGYDACTNRAYELESK